MLRLIVSALLLVGTVGAQHTPDQPMPILPEIPFDYSDIISVVAEYHVLQEDNITFCSQFYGLTDFSSRTITVCSRSDSAIRQLTVLHETLHILYWRRGILTGGAMEPVIDSKARELFRKFFGGGVKLSEPQKDSPTPATSA